MNKVFPIIQEDDDCSAVSIRSNNLKMQNHIVKDFSQKNQRTCKICLEQEILNSDQIQDRQRDSQMVCPCDCKGSLKYVHQKCLKIWLVKQKNTENLTKICCELCQSQIFFKSQHKPQCRCSWHHLKSLPKFNLASLIIQISTIVLLSLFLSNYHQPQQRLYIKYVLLSFLTVTSIIFLLTIFWTAKQLFIIKIQKIHKIYSIQECQELGLRPNQKRIILTKQIRDSFCIRVKKTKEKVRNSLELNPCVMERIIKKRSAL